MIPENLNVVDTCKTRPDTVYKHKIGRRVAGALCTATQSESGSPVTLDLVQGEKIKGRNRRVEDGE